MVSEFGSAGHALCVTRNVTVCDSVCDVCDARSPQVVTMVSDQLGTLGAKWDPKNLEIRTMSVERTLEPLVLQV